MSNITPASNEADVLREALIKASMAILSMKVEAETAAQGDEQMMLEACEQISNEGLAADMAIRAALAGAAQPVSVPPGYALTDSYVQQVPDKRGAAITTTYQSTPPAMPNP